MYSVQDFMKDVRKLADKYAGDKIDASQRTIMNRVRLHYRFQTRSPMTMMEELTTNLQQGHMSVFGETFIYPTFGRPNETYVYARDMPKSKMPIAATLIHELAHSITSERNECDNYNHGSLWQSNAMTLGINVCNGHEPAYFAEDPDSWTNKDLFNAIKALPEPDYSTIEE